MDGPTIQAAVEVALAARHHHRRRAARRSRAVAATGAPTLVMTYWNPIERYGAEPLRRRPGRRRAAPAVITPDLIPDEAGRTRRTGCGATDATGLDRVFLVAPVVDRRADRG